jgi:predicted ATPase
VRHTPHGRAWPTAAARPRHVYTEAFGGAADEHRGTILAPELLRLDGELSLIAGRADAGDAERTFRAAIDLARARGERSLELRAATSLGRLLADRGRRAEAQRDLAAAYGAFTEGFDTRDLREAKSLLDAL